MPIEYNYRRDIINLISADDTSYNFGDSDQDYMRVTIIDQNNSPLSIPSSGLPAIFYSNTIYNNDNKEGLSLNDSLKITVPSLGGIDKFSTREGMINDFKIYQDASFNYFIKPNEILSSIGASERNYTIKIDFLNQFNYDNNFLITERSTSGREIRLKNIDASPIYIACPPQSLMILIEARKQFHF